MHKKKILIISLAYFPKFVGGAEVAVKEITDRLGDKYEFDMVTLRLDSNLSREERLGKINICRVGPSGRVSDVSSLPFVSKLAKILMPFIAYRRARNLHKKNKYDIVWAIMANQSGLAASMLKKKFPSLKFVLTLQEGDPINDILHKVRFFKRAFTNIFQRADHVQAISNYLSDFAKLMGTSNPISVVPNGVDLNVFKKERGSDFKIKLGYSMEDVVVVSASRLVEKNGLTNLIISFVHLPKNYHLIILGEGIMREMIEGLIKKESLQNRVKLFGYIDQLQIPKFFNISNVFARPSLSEGLGNVFLEAMACELPVIATAVGGIPDIVQDGVTGVIVPINDPKYLAEKIKQASSNDAYINKIKSYAKQIVTENYSWDSISSKIDDIFCKIR